MVSPDPWTRARARAVAWPSMSEVSRGKGKGGGRNSEKKEVAAAKGSSAASSKGGSASKGSAGKGGGSAGQGETKGRPGGKSEGNVGKSRGKGKSAKGKPSPTELPKVDWEWPTNEAGHPAFAWPPQDPAWWAALASQLPAAWGTGAWGGTSFPEDEAAAKKDEKDVKANLNEEATDKSGAVVPAGKDAKDVTDNLFTTQLLWLLLLLLLFTTPLLSGVTEKLFTPRC
ncbi:unnamed protein product [Polarella glacialis]|uniref:Uncharacterized protein n=1 Tax=Polarella glacialis TaxID=89957 RepID=A0A813KZJ5_POLGL|nr:unnamed protein product [Polarella glacialis]